MKKITIYFQDLNKSAQEELVKKIKSELKEEIEDNYNFHEGHISRETIEQEMINDYINRHNVANNFEI